MTAVHATALPVAAPTMSLDLEFYIEAFLQRWGSENTRRGYRSDIETLQTWCTAKGLDLFSLHRIHLEVFMRYLADERQNSATTIIHRIGTITQFFDLAVEDGLAAKNPTRLLKLPKRPPVDATSKALSSRDYERLVWAAAESNPTEYALVLTMGMCGLRISPACSLDVETATVVDQVMIRLAKVAGINQRVTNHTLRHTFAVTSLSGGATLEETALSLGHRDSSTTFRYYGRKTIPNNQHTSHRVAGSILLPSLDGDSVSVGREGE